MASYMYTPKFASRLYTLYIDLFQLEPMILETIMPAWRNAQATADPQSAYRNNVT